MSFCKFTLKYLNSLYQCQKRTTPVTTSMATLMTLVRPFSVLYLLIILFLISSCTDANLSGSVQIQSSASGPPPAGKFGGGASVILGAQASPYGRYVVVGAVSGQNGEIKLSSSSSAYVVRLTRRAQ